MRRPTVPPELRRGPFTIEQAAAVGVTREMLRSSVWRRVMRGV